MSRGWLTMRPSAPRCRSSSRATAYVPGREQQPLLLAGTGTGLAPLYGIARDALAAGHHGPIHLVHGVPSRRLYLRPELLALADEHANFTYTASVLDEDGPMDKAMLARHPSLKGWRAYVCGDPAIVQRMRKTLFLAGAALNDIHADAFHQPRGSDAGGSTVAVR